MQSSSLLPDTLQTLCRFDETCVGLALPVLLTVVGQAIHRVLTFSDIVARPLVVLLLGQAIHRVGVLIAYNHCVSDYGKVSKFVSVAWIFPDIVPIQQDPQFCCLLLIGQSIHQVGVLIAYNCCVSDYRKISKSCFCLIVS